MQEKADNWNRVLPIVEFLFAFEYYQNVIFAVLLRCKSHSNFTSFIRYWECNTEETIIPDKIIFWKI